MPELNRQQVNDEIARIVHRHEPHLNRGQVASMVMVGDMIRELQVHMDATVDAAYAWGAEDAAVNR